MKATTTCSCIIIFLISLMPLKLYEKREYTYKFIYSRFRIALYLAVWSAAIHCRFDKFWSAVRPRTALEYFGLRHGSCRFRFARRHRTASRYFGLRRVSRRFGLQHVSYCFYIITRLVLHHARLDTSALKTFPTNFLQYDRKHIKRS